MIRMDHGHPRNTFNVGNIELLDVGVPWLMKFFLGFFVFKIATFFYYGKNGWLSKETIAQ